MDETTQPEPIHDEPLDNPHTSDEWVRGADSYDQPADAAPDPAVPTHSSAFGVPAVPEDDVEIQVERRTPGPRPAGTPAASPAFGVPSVPEDDPDIQTEHRTHG